MDAPHHDPDRLDPTDQSGRPWMVSGMVAALLIVLTVMLIIGILLMT